MKCLYYLAPNLVSTGKVSDDLHDSGIADWFIHIISEDEQGLSRDHLHSSNYLETLDIVREAIIGALFGFMGGLIVALIFKITQPFGQEIPFVAYASVVIVCSMFGCWVGGLDGWSHRNRKIERFMPDIEAGKNLVLIYAKEHQLNTILTMMVKKHPEAALAATDSRFLNPFSKLEPVGTDSGARESVTASSMIG